MADIAQKKGAYIRRYVKAVQDFIDATDELTNLKTEWDANAYASGASPAGNNITDTDMTAAAPWATAEQMNQVIGAVESIRTAIGQNRGYIEALRT